LIMRLDEDVSSRWLQTSTVKPRSGRLFTLMIGRGAPNGAQEEQAARFNAGQFKKGKAENE
jgi:hypothetical protein